MIIFYITYFIFLLVLTIMVIGFIEQRLDTYQFKGWVIICLFAVLSVSTFVPLNYLMPVMPAFGPQNVAKANERYCEQLSHRNLDPARCGKSRTLGQLEIKPINEPSATDRARKAVRDTLNSRQRLDPSKNYRRTYPEAHVWTHVRSEKARDESISKYERDAVSLERHRRDQQRIRNMDNSFDSAYWSELDYSSGHSMGRSDAYSDAAVSSSYLEGYNPRTISGSSAYRSGYDSGYNSGYDSAYNSCLYTC